MSEVHPQGDTCPWRRLERASTPRAMIEILEAVLPHPVLLRRQYIARGYADEEVDGALRRGEIERVGRGAVALPASGATEYDVALDRYVRRVIARSLQAPGSVVSHLSAAALHGLPADAGRLSNVHLTRPGRGGNRTGEGFRLHSAVLRPRETVELRGLPVTSVARTLVDVARSEYLAAAVAILDHALREEQAGGDEILAALRGAAHSPGMRRARRACALADGRAESVGESRARVTMINHGLSGLESQVNVYDAGGSFLGRTDFGLLGDATLIEYDGESKYGRLLRPGETVTDAVLREKRREERLTETGFVVIRITKGDLRQPAELIRRISDARWRGQRNRAAGLVTGSAVPLPANRVIG